MNVRSCAEFKSSLPYDGVEDETGSYFVEYPGKGVATALAEMFRRFGCEVEGPVSAGDHGWQFGIKANRGRFWCQLTMIEDYLFIFENTSWFDRLVGRTPASFLILLRGLAKALAADPRFSDVRWFRREDLMTSVPGSPTPLD